MLSAIKDKIITLFQLFLVFTYIIFEEVIWEGIAKPIFTYVHGLKIVQKVEVVLQRSNRYVILSLFLLMFVLVEAAGIYAGILIVSGQVVLALALYISKIPITAFTFWLFRVTEDKLMQFGWFKWLYEKIMAMIDWIKGCEVYIKTLEKAKSLKASIKTWFSALKAKYFAKESPFVTRIKKLYRRIKAALRRA